ncbi:MAG: DegT/DnrJ/EryC1/StrS aminotransferase family protein [Eubacteriales bacterium]|nr:DegT/DnrJ/EryC1/StrS aminotransferase family protein [Eubacteriales bacterium]
MINLPLMDNNITREDVGFLIEFLQKNDIFTQNKNVVEFEKLWSQWLGVKHSIFVNSGSSANFITMAILKELYGEGEIIASPIGWSSDIAAIINAGHKPVFADVNLENLSMNDERIIEKITTNTKAVLLTHVLGFNALTDKLLKILKERNIPLIEDCCESHGATHKGQKIGTFGRISNFSFYYAHHMSTIEGGMICTDDEKLYQYARMFRSHGMTRECNSQEYKNEFENLYTETYPEFTFAVPGFNMRSTELNAVIGLNQLKRLDANNRSRYENFKLFVEQLDPGKYFTDFKLDGSINYAFILLVRNGDDELYQRVVKMFREENVEFRRGTAGGGNLARQPFLKKACPGVDAKKLTNAEYIHQYGMYLGNYPTLEKEKINMLCRKLNEL